MSVPQTYPGGFATGVSGTDRPLVDPPESIGTPFDDAATAQNTTNSAFALMKGALAGLGFPASSADETNPNNKFVSDPLAALGDGDDPPATNTTDDWSAISLLKGILSQAEL